ncbi:hypothetical protein [Polyangium aurulentum]|uniref:hypothetical protein n=1 Tax=Polyangium aurulentum TaxID=2567896 RepID=UPI0010AE6878|nr:hypothetical protein [Polyangium aurulentum]UQA55509.1 hypothetical protein E8A73_029700 [Polyangium aurulentum]
MGSLARFLWSFCLSLLVLLSARAAAAGGDGFTEIRVCVRDPRLKPTVGEWVYSMSSSDILTTTDEARFRSQSEGKTRFVYDPAAPESNNIFLPIPYNKLECPAYVLPVKPKAPPPPPKPEGKKGKDEDGDGDGKPAVKKREKAEGPPPKSKPQDVEEEIHHQKRPPRERKPEEEVLPQAKVLPPPERLPEEKPTLPVVQKSRKPRPMVAACGECKGNGKGDKPGATKTAADEIGQEMAITAAILTQNMNEDLHRPDGKKNGIIGGQNPDGINVPAAQIVASAVLIGTAVGIPGFRKKLMEAIRKKTPFILEIKDLSEEAAEAIAKEHGAHIADALNKVGAIGPYRLMKKFTERLKGDWQAHHILEDSMFRKFKKQLGDPDRGPSVILTKAQHKEITAKLLEAKTQSAETTAQLWERYKEAYEDYPHWLDAIKSYFEKAK